MRQATIEEGQANGANQGIVHRVRVLRNEVSFEGFHRVAGPRSSLGRVSSLDFDAWRQIKRDVAMRVRDVTANVGIRVERFGLHAIKAEHQFFLFVHGEFIPRPLNHVPQGCSRTERVGLSHAIEDDVDFHFFAAADVDSFVFAGFKAAVVSQFFIRVLDADAPVLGLELAQVALFAETLD